MKLDLVIAAAAAATVLVSDRAVARDIVLVPLDATKCVVSMEKSPIYEKPGAYVPWSVKNYCATDQTLYLHNWAPYNCGSTATTGLPFKSPYNVAAFPGVTVPRRSGTVPGTFNVVPVLDVNEGCWRYAISLCRPGTAGCQPETDPEIEVHRGNRLEDLVAEVLRTLQKILFDRAAASGEEKK